MALAFIQWLRWYFAWLPQPWRFTALALVASRIVARCFYRTRGAICRLKQARDGECAVGQCLDERATVRPQVLLRYAQTTLRLRLHALRHTPGTFCPRQTVLGA